MVFSHRQCVGLTTRSGGVTSPTVIPSKARDPGVVVAILVQARTRIRRFADMTKCPVPAILNTLYLETI